MNAIPLPTLLIPVTAAVLLLGAILLTLGLRGRRINDHPVCRKCRFDLHGIYPGRDTCPECGRDLGARRAVRRGERRRRRWAAALGALLLLASLGAIGAGGYAAARGANLNPWKPTWMLAMESRRSEPGRAAGALKELIARLEQGRLSDGRIESLVARGLEVQADPDQRWLTEWGDLVEESRARGHVTEEQYAAYVRQSLGWEGALSQSHRDRVARGDALAMSLVMNGARIGNRDDIWFSARLESMTVDGETTVIPGAGGGGMASVGGGSRGRIMLPGARITAPEGRHRLQGTWRVSLGRAPQAGEWAVARTARQGPPMPPPPEVEWTVTLPGEIEVVAPGVPLIAEIDDPALAGRMRAAVRIDGAWIRQAGDALEPSGALMFQQPPVPVAFDVYWRAGEHEWKVGSVAAPATGGYGVGYGHGPDPIPAGFDARTVDIILRSNPEAALNNPDITEIWKGELVFEGVEVEWPEPASGE